MRKLMILAASTALALSACTESSESYQIGASQAWSKLSSAGYAISTYGMPMGLKSVDVKLDLRKLPG